MHSRQQRILQDIAALRREGKAFEAWDKVCQVLTDSDHPAEFRDELWLQHFVGRFADFANESPVIRSDVPYRHSANLLWDVARQAIQESDYRKWLESPNLDTIQSIAESISDRLCGRYARRATDLLGSACQIVNAFGSLLRTSEPGPFFRHAASAVRGYISFWKSSPDTDHRRLLLRLDPTDLAPPDLSASFPDVGGPGWQQWVKGATDVALRAIEDQWSDLVPPTALQVGLAMAGHALLWVSGQEPSTQRQGKTTVLFAGSDPLASLPRHGAFAFLEVTRHTDDGSVLYPNPTELGLMVLDEEWLCGFERASTFACKGSVGGTARFSWSLRFPPAQHKADRSESGCEFQQRSPVLTGASASAAAACTMVALRDDRQPHPSRCITAIINEDGKLGPVGGLDAKLLA
jgi:hypothetical protein